MRSRSPSLCALLLLAAALAACAPAAPLRDETARREMLELQQKQQEMAREVARLQQSVAAIEGQLGTQQRMLEELHARPAAQKVTGTGEKTGAATPSPPAPTATGGSAPADLYRQAFGDYASGRCPQAITGFENFLRLNPYHEQAGNALFWLGECYYAEKQYPKAAEAFGRAAEDQTGARAPEALLRLAAALKQMHDDRRAQEILELLRQQYPDSDAARKSLGSE